MWCLWFLLSEKNVRQIIDRGVFAVAYRHYPQTIPFDGWMPPIPAPRTLQVQNNASYLRCYGYPWLDYGSDWWQRSVYGWYIYQASANKSRALFITFQRWRVFVIRIMRFGDDISCLCVAIGDFHRLCIKRTLARFPASGRAADLPQAEPPSPW